MRRGDTVMKTRTALAVTAICFVTAGLAAGQRGRGEPPPVAGVQQKTYRFAETNEKIEYDVFVSRKVDKKNRNPLVIALHGANEQPMGLMRSLTELADKGGYILAAPTGYTLDGGYGVPALRSRGAAADNTAERSEKDVMN